VSDAFGARILRRIDLAYPFWAEQDPAARAKSLFEEERFEQAIQECNRGLKANPRTLFFTAKEGILKRALKRMKKRFQTSMLPSDSIPNCTMPMKAGAGFTTNRDDAGALKEYQTAIGLNPRLVSFVFLGIDDLRRH